MVILNQQWEVIIEKQKCIAQTLNDSYIVKCNGTVALRAHAQFIV